MLHRKGFIIALASIVAHESSPAQAQPATVPTVLAQAMTANFGGMLGVPVFVVGTAPAGWPSELVPAMARVIGGGVIGEPDLFRIRMLVVEMPATAATRKDLLAMASKAGYSERMVKERELQGGFVDSPGVMPEGPLCKDSKSVFSFTPVDSVRSPRIFALHYMDGEAARQNCDAAERSRTMSRGGMARFGPRNMPAVVPPRGVTAIGSGFGWSGSSGESRTMLRTRMPVDSILAHYTTQLVAAGWKPDGGALANQAIGVQKFTFRDGEEPWSAALIIMTVGDRRELGLRLSKVNGED